MSDTIQGQPGQLAAFNFDFPSTLTMRFELFSSSLTPTDEFITPLPWTLRCTISRPGGVTIEDVPFTIAGTVIEIQTALPVNQNDLIVIQPWNSQLRGLNGEFIAFTIIMVP